MIPENSAGQVWATSPGCLPLFLGLGSFSSAKVWVLLSLSATKLFMQWPLQAQPGAGLSWVTYLQSAGQFRQNLRLLSERGSDGWGASSVWLVTGSKE